MCSRCLGAAILLTDPENEILNSKFASSNANGHPVEIDLLDQTYFQAARSVSEKILLCRPRFQPCLHENFTLHSGLINSSRLLCCHGLVQNIGSLRRNYSLANPSTQIPANDLTTMSKAPENKLRHPQWRSLAFGAFLNGSLSFTAFNKSICAFQSCPSK